jgi:tetratricopeptide (TPR) repeat protein
MIEHQLSRCNDIIRFQPNDPHGYIRRGMVYFKLARIDESIQDFDFALKLDRSLTPYLWQRGLSYYYAQRFLEGANQFEIDLTVNYQDVEETLWRYLCIARMKGVAEARSSLLTVKNDPRPIMQHIYDFYGGNCTPDDVIAAGKLDGKRGEFYSHLYLGLYYEVDLQLQPASEYIVKAADDYQIDDYMWHLAQVHKMLLVNGC